MGATVLVIEDNNANLELLMFLLRAFGHTPMAAIEGRQALEVARQNPPDLILCDMQLPVMDGYELAKRLRAEPRLRNVPLIAVTAFAMPGDREKAIAAGCDGYIPKPIDPASFLSLLDPFLEPEMRSRRPETADEPESDSENHTASALSAGLKTLAPAPHPPEANGHGHDPHS